MKTMTYSDYEQAMKKACCIEERDELLTQAYFDRGISYGEYRMLSVLFDLLDGAC